MPKKKKDLITKVFESSVKAFNDESLTIEHFISTEQRDRSKDIMRADGMVMDGIPVVLKQHGFDPDTGSEPIAKPVSITIGTDENGNKGILVKTQYYDGSSLTPPDNTGMRLYQKAKENFMPYWSIGFTGLEQKPLAGGGTDYSKWLLFEYSQVGVPDNITAKVVKSLEDAEQFFEDEKNKNELFTFEINKDEKKSLPFTDISKIERKNLNDLARGCYYDEDKDQYTVIDNEKKSCVCSIENFQGAPAFILTKDHISKDHRKLLHEVFEKQYDPTKFKSIADRVRGDIPYQAMSTLWWAMSDELYYSDGKEKSVKAILKEYIDLLTPFALSFAQETTENPDDFKEIKTKIDKKLSTDNKDLGDGSAPSEPVSETPPTENKNTLKLKKSPVLKLKPATPKTSIKLGMNRDKLIETFKGIMKEEFSTEINKLKGVVE